MLFRRRPPESPPARDEWKALADRLGLKRAAGGEGLLREMLDLPEDAALGPVYHLEQAGDVKVYVFDFREGQGAGGRDGGCVTACLLASPRPLSEVSWRASRRLHKVLSSIQASASGGEIVEVPGAPGFNERITVVSRQPEAAAALFTPAVRQVLERSLGRLETPPLLTVSDRQIMLSARGSEPAYGALEFLISDVLSLYVALQGRG